MTLRRVAVMLVLTIMIPGVAWATDLKPIKAQRAKDITVTLLSETGQWKPGSNSFVLQFTSADKKAADVGKVALSTSMPMPGMAPMAAAATVEPEGPGRYRGTIGFPDAGDRQVTVRWDGPAGKGSTRFTVPVR